MNSRRWPGRLRGLAFGGAAVLLLYLARGQLLPLAAAFLDVSQPPQPVDYVVVLGGDSATRPFVAAALVKKGLAGKVLVPVSKPSSESEDGLGPPEHEIIRRVLVARGVAEQNIVLLPGDCRSTFDEARVVADFLQGQPDRSLAVVTTTYHTRRTRWVFHKVLGARAARVCFVASPTEEFDENNWWRTESGFMTYTNEYGKLAFYLVRY